jgi:hypothetical protein
MLCKVFGLGSGKGMFFRRRIGNGMAVSILLALAQPGCGRAPVSMHVPVTVDQIPGHIVTVVAGRWAQATTLHPSLYPLGIFELVIENLDNIRQTIRISLAGKIPAVPCLKT